MLHQTADVPRIALFVCGHYDPQQLVRLIGVGNRDNDADFRHKYFLYRLSAFSARRTRRPIFTLICVLLGNQLMEYQWIEYVCSVLSSFPGRAIQRVKPVFRVNMDTCDNLLLSVADKAKAFHHIAV